MKYTLIEQNEDWINIGTACQLLGVSRSSIYAWKANAELRTTKTIAAKQLLAVINHEFQNSRGTYSSLKIAEALRKQG